MRSSEVSALTNEQLLASLKTMVGDERRLMANMLEYLAEVEARGLHAELGCSSMFDFCRRKLGLSEDQSCRRIAVARLGHRFPQVFVAIRVGRLHLSSADKLEALFTKENVVALIDEASGMSMPKIELLKARLDPQAHVEESMRKLPQPRIAGSRSQPALPALPRALESSTATATAPAAMQTAASVELAPAPAPALELAAKACAVIPVAQSLTLKPLSETGYRLTLTADTALHDDLMKLRALMKRENPKGDFLPILKAAVALLVEKKEAERLGKTKRPRKSNGPADPADVSRGTKREVHERDGSQCTFVSADGERCPARELLELDHRQPRALGGKGGASNIRLLCRTHNRYAAEQLFGREFMAAKIRARTNPERRGCADASGESHTTIGTSNEAEGSDPERRGCAAASAEPGPRPSNEAAATEVGWLK